TPGQPACRLHRTTCESEPIAGAVRQLDTLAQPGEGHGVVAHHVAAAKYRKADRAATPRLAGAVPVVLRRLLQVYPASGCRRGAQPQRGARWRILLVAVMRFENLDIVIRIELA